jgi:hypothetical protein
MWSLLDLWNQVVDGIGLNELQKLRVLADQIFHLLLTAIDFGESRSALIGVSHQSAPPLAHTAQGGVCRAWAEEDHPLLSIGAVVVHRNTSDRFR